MKKTMRVSDVLSLYSIDSNGCEGPTARDVIFSPTNEADMRLEMYKRMRDDIEADGLIYPIHVFKSDDTNSLTEYGFGYEEDMPEFDEVVEIMGNGHHRLRIAYDLGWTEIETTSDIWESGWE